MNRPPLVSSSPAHFSSVHLEDFTFNLQPKDKVMEYPDRNNRTVLVFTGNIADIDSLHQEIKKFTDLNRGNQRALVLMINSAGGVTEHVLALCDLIRFVKSEGHPVCVHILGQLDGYTYLIASEADLRVMEDTANLAFRQPIVTAGGNSKAIKNEIERETVLHNKLVKAIADRSRNQLVESAVRAWKGRHFSAKEALQFGLCDIVLERPAGVVPKGDKPEHRITFMGKFSNQYVMSKLIEINEWMENEANAERPLRIMLTSEGGNVPEALTLYGLLLEVQRRGHHLTIHVMGQAYSCALWFITCALGSGTVLIGQNARLMYHPYWMKEFSAPLDEIADLLDVQQKIFHLTNSLQSLASGFTPAVLKEWEAGEDHYFDAQTAVEMGLGVLA